MGEYRFITDREEIPLYIIRFNTTYLLKKPVEAENKLVKMLDSIIRGKNRS